MGEEQIVLKMYFAGINEKAEAHVGNLQELCEKKFPGKYTIEVIDLVERPELAIDEQIFAAPTIVKKLPKPVRKVIGDLADTEGILVGLDILSGRE